MRLAAIVFLLCLILTGLPLHTCGQRRSVSGPTDPRELEKFLDSIFAEEMNKQNIPGAVFIFVKDGKVFFSKGYGFANLEKQQHASPEQTPFRIGSISKVFTATAVAQLADRKRINLHTDVNQYLTKLKVAATFPEPVTPVYLITHSAGFDEIRPGTQGPNAASVLPLADFLRPRLMRIRPPGEVIAYSTYGITLAGPLAHVSRQGCLRSHLSRQGCLRCASPEDHLTLK
jgi:CubicO group peptidase (beta-lactamase class C family)